VKTLVDARLRLEAARFGFRFACDDCAHFHLDRCSLGYPAEPRRDALQGTHLETCKEFDVA
jgi:hypothetical protein